MNCKFAFVMTAAAYPSIVAAIYARGSDIVANTNTFLAALAFGSTTSASYNYTVIGGYDNVTVRLDYKRGAIYIFHYIIYIK